MNAFLKRMPIFYLIDSVDVHWSGRSIPLHHHTTDLGKCEFEVYNIKTFKAICSSVIMFCYFHIV